MSKLVNVFWTSGLDSTCRIVELASAEGYQIQPWYLHDRSRRSSKIEMEHIRKMTELIRNNPATHSVLLDTKFEEVDKIEIPENLHECFARIARFYLIGKQYEWISAFLNSRRMIAEIAAEAPWVGIYTALLGECKVMRNGEGVGAELVADPEKSSEAGLLLFRNYALPEQIMQLFKTDEVAEMKSLGYEDVFNLTWFCHRPVFGMPCGHCGPCRDAKRDGLGYRIPLSGRMLCHIVRIFGHNKRKS